MLIRALVVSFSVAALWWSSSSFGLGLGLGELKIDSNLAAPLKASVTLRGMNSIDLDPEQFSIRIDSDSKSKIEYRLLRMDSDTTLIQLYTRDIISDPLFEFRIEVKWDSSTVARSYDALVDPPNYEEYFRTVNETEIAESVATVSVPSAREIGKSPADNQVVLPVETVTALNDESAAGTVIAAVSEEPVSASAAADPGSLSSQTQREYGPTIDGNSIWRVARAVATDNPDLTIYQWMYAIWKSNPDAFAYNNMHRLRMEKVLGIPFESQVSSTSHLSAWRAYSEQMAVLQITNPVKSDDESVTTVDAVPEIPAVAEIQEIDVQQTVLATDEPQAQMPVAGAGIIALLEESASFRDEESVVNRESGVPGSTADTSILINSISADASPAFDSNGTSPSAEVDTTNEFEGVAETRVELNADPILLDTLDAEMTENSQSTAVAENETVVDAAPVAVRAQEMPEWTRALLERYDYIDQLPVIGSDGSLSFVGRSVQAADRFIATRPSWATLAFGIWVTLVLLLLRQEILSRRKTAVVAVSAALPEALEADETVEQDKADQDNVRVDGKEKHLAKSAAAPKKVDPVPSNAPAIIAQADAILARGDTEEAMKLMRLAVELQPGQPTLVIHLLELYHRTRSTELFDELIDRSSHVLESLDSRDQTRLEVMHAELCPDTTFPIGRGELVINHEMPVGDGDNADTDNADTESGPVSGLVEEIGVPSDLDATAEVDASIADQESELEKQAELDHQVPAVFKKNDFENQHVDDSEDDKFIQTQVIFTNNGVPLREEATPMPGMVGEVLDLEVTLKEADVYLAYGLYESAEELLLKGMEVDPERIDFLARLLDSYYATRNVVDFVTCAKVMLDMGEAGAEHWERVEIMGFELAPYNNLFANGKDKSLIPVVLEIPKPEIADFDFSDLDASSESTFTDIPIVEDSESTFTDIKIDKCLDDDSESTDPDLNPNAEITDLEFSEVGDTSESTFTDIKIGKYLDDDSDDSDVTDLNLDLESHEINDEDGSLFDDLISELDDSADTIESEMVVDDETLEVNLDATTNDLDPVLAVDLEAAEDELKASIADEVEDDDEVIDLDYGGEEDAIQFTMEHDSLDGDLTSEEFAPVDNDQASLELVDGPTLGTLSGVKLGSDNSRILYFPDSPSEDRDIDKFESEVKTTLQAIRDQLQNMTERLFQQERATNDLKQTIAELKSENMPVAKNIKESS